MTTPQTGTPRVDILFAIMGMVILGAALLYRVTGAGNDGSVLVAGVLALLCTADLVKRRTGRYLMMGAAMGLMIWYFVQR